MSSENGTERIAMEVSYKKLWKLLIDKDMKKKEKREKGKVGRGMATKTLTIRCPHCGSDNVSKNGHNKAGKQVYRCNNPACERYSFVEEYTKKAYDPEVRRQVVKLAIDCTGTRATGRILGISKDSVTSILKKQKTGPGR